MTLVNVVLTVNSLLATILPLMAALALLFFLWGLALTILQSENAERRSDGRNIMIWGIIALFVLVAVWGLVSVLQNTFGLGRIGDCQAPQIGRGDPNCG